MKRKWLPKGKWKKLRRAFAYGHSLGAISVAIGVPGGRYAPALPAIIGPAIAALM